MQTIAPGPLFDIRFRLRTFLAAVTVICVFLALCPLIATKPGYAIFSTAFLLACAALTAYAISLAIRNTPRYLGILIIFHLTIATLLIVGPILSYHVNGRAWYDYGLSTWNPPVSIFNDGTTGIHDYDPKFTPPATWPTIGPIMYEMCWLSIYLLLFPPVAPVVSIALLTLAIRLRNVLSRRQKLVALLAWSVGSLPLLCMIFWGGHVLEWIAD